MKVIFSMSWMFLLAVNTLAQEKADPPPQPFDLVIISNKSYLPVPEKAGPLDPLKPVSDQVQARAEHTLHTPTLPPEHPLRNPNAAATRHKFYSYELMLRNAGQKTIRRVTWRYLFIDPDTKRQIGERSFVSDVKIPPGKTRKLTESSTQPPIKKYSANQKDKKSQVSPSETVIMLSIEYSDGSVWNPIW